MKSIVIDAFGGDYAPEEAIKSAIEAVTKWNDVKILLAGKEEEIQTVLDKNQFDNSRIEILPASEMIEMGEEPVQAVRAKKNSSLVVGMNALQTGQAQAFVSAGSTGAILAGGTFVVGRIKGVKRPSLATILPRMDGKQVILLDGGANVDCKPIHLQQFAIMGSCYAQLMFGVPDTRVGLLNIGSEAEKGNELTKMTYSLLKNMPIHFVGNCEAREILQNNFDVVVADGFDGNIALKSIEGTAIMIMKMLKKELTSSMQNKLGALLAKSAFTSLKNTMDYKKVGGAILLGVKGCVFKLHGDSKAETFLSGIENAKRSIENNLTEKIQQAMATQMEG